LALSSGRPDTTWPSWAKATVICLSHVSQVCRRKAAVSKHVLSAARLLDSSILPPRLLGAPGCPKQTSAPNYGCTCATRTQQRKSTTWYYTPRMHVAYAGYAETRAQPTTILRPLATPRCPPALLAHLSLGVKDTRIMARCPS
jgi:hypothetical protein